MKRTFIALAVAGLAASSFAATESDVDNSFSPYKGGFPTLPGLTPGVVITKANVEQFKAAFDPGLFDMVKAGWVEIKVGKSSDFPQPKPYIEATRKNLNKAKLGAKNGELEGFIAGRPFPEEPKESDPRAGEKLAWNYKYGVNYGDSGSIYPFYWRYRNAATGQIERTIKFQFNFLNFMHRTEQAPIPEVTPNPAKMFRAIYAKVFEPQDLKNTQLLIQRFEDDTKLDDAYLSLGFQRRVRRLATGQTTDAFLGSDMMIEDFEGYNGRISDMKWAYKGTKNILVPFFNHNEQKLTDEYKEPDGYKFVDFHGKGNCMPNVTYQLRKAYVLEATPVNPNHPMSKKVMYLDAQTMYPGRAVIYDRKGQLWKNFTIGKSHPDHHLPANKGSDISLDDSFSQVDMQAMHCTTGQFKVHIDAKLNPPGLFSVQNMRGGD
ncbi:DUF1329 domain-containing protein [Denitratisoma oestradiolicum]|uniref:Outer membrane lipoprotein-sorting protein n=1 Tax=Denitratisoma oestradiolicum TaxID=311182 RepID=A0A6S6XUB9_9PROT|nr:DUF1329 domain-containing protein [Denitratisoma oestradiolicum]TWO79516.1 outer membrane lipoprotein-sorting protein [Denitratisoma oestradiolicum]CAB1368385.1 conserved exported protein of unknown function [Denitratisoma oestradiolicum]